MQTDTLTFTSMSPTFAVDLIIGLPTIEGKMCAGKFDPANPHLTNCETKIAQNNLLDTKHFLHCSSKSSSPLFHYHRRVLYFPWNPWRCSQNLPLAKNKMAATNFLNALSRDQLERPTPPPRPASTRHARTRVPANARNAQRNRRVFRILLIYQ